MFQVEQLLLLYFTFKGCQQQILKLWNFMVYIFNKIKNLFKNKFKVPSFETIKWKIILQNWVDWRLPSEPSFFVIPKITEIESPK